MVGRGVAVTNGVTVGAGVNVLAGVGVAVAFPPRVRRPSARTEAAPTSSTAPAIPPMIHGIQFICFLTTSLKLGGTEINTTVILS